ncbi:hypothetical protein FXO38_23709 [Capsicum annuum]|nr:hypothetical protein FXO38_23709 [Capsicum annuum]KAF3684594.1 hypothetical protein FXO37_01276 [Capsicum annuum]
MVVPAAIATTSFSGIHPLKEKFQTHVEPINNHHTRANNMSYADKLKSKAVLNNISRVTPKSVIMLQGEPSVTRKSSEIQNLIIQENLQHVIISKFFYGKPDIKELRNVLPGQCGI